MKVNSRKIGFMDSVNYIISIHRNYKDHLIIKTLTKLKNIGSAMKVKKYLFRLI